MKVSFLILILTFLSFSQIFSMRIREKSLKDQFKTLKIQTQLGAKHTPKPKKVINVNVNFSTLHHKQQCKKQLKQGAESKKSKVKRQRIMNIFWDYHFGKTCVLREYIFHI
jgi:hypothetical protein